jgi:hypothetical protein
MDSARREASFDLLKRDGRREAYDRAKLTRSLVRAGVASYMLPGILDTVAPNPGQDTGSLRANVEAELEAWHPNAARRYAQTRRVYACGSGALVRGSVGLHPETTTSFGVKPGDTIWLGENETRLPLTVETMPQVEPGQVWLNSADLAGMGVCPGARLLATRFCPATPRHGVSFALVERHDAPVLASP